MCGRPRSRISIFACRDGLSIHGINQPLGIRLLLLHHRHQRVQLSWDCIPCLARSPEVARISECFRTLDENCGHRCRKRRTLLGIYYLLFPLLPIAEQYTIYGHRHALHCMRHHLHVGQRPRGFGLGAARAIPDQPIDSPFKLRVKRDFVPDAACCCQHHQGGRRDVRHAVSPEDYCGRIDISGLMQAAALLLIVGSDTAGVGRCSEHQIMVYTSVLAGVCPLWTSKTPCIILAVHSVIVN